jgi:acetylornithine deacetylase/succinyl-diaminopimelate desuccinylase-like protein
VTVPGFYDDVRVVDEPERLALAASAPTDAAIRREAGVRRAWGDRGYSAYERTTLRPALTVNGITGGYQGEGTRSVIPARASAKLGLRLVPDQDPTTIERLIREDLARRAPATVRASFRARSRARPVLVDPAHPLMDAAVAACRHGFGVRPAFLRSGGTIPAVGSLCELLGVPTVLLGFALPDDRAHAPNERFHLPTLWRGVETCIWFLHELMLRSRPRAHC